MLGATIIIKSLDSYAMTHSVPVILWGYEGTGTHKNKPWFIKYFAEIFIQTSANSTSGFCATIIDYVWKNVTTHAICTF